MEKNIFVLIVCYFLYFFLEKKNYLLFLYLIFYMPWEVKVLKFAYITYGYSKFMIHFQCVYLVLDFVFNTFLYSFLFFFSSCILLHLPSFSCSLFSLTFGSFILYFYSTSAIFFFQCYE